MPFGQAGVRHDAAAAKRRSAVVYSCSGHYPHAGSGGREAKGYLTKSASPDDGRVTYITATEAGRQLWDKYDTQYFSELLPALQDIPEEDAACMIRTIETLYQVLAERRNNVGKQ